MPSPNPGLRPPPSRPAASLVVALSLIAIAPPAAPSRTADAEPAAGTGDERTPAGEDTGAGDELPGPHPGERVDDFLLRDVTGRPHRLSSYSGREAVVLCFTGVGCPISEIQVRRLNRLADRYAKRGVEFLGINANRQDEVIEIRGWVKEYEVGFPVLKDHRNVLADRLGARRTTEVYVLDAGRRLRYRGALDDQLSLGRGSVGYRKERPERRWLVEALEAVLGGEDVEVATTAPQGCVIGRERRTEAPGDAAFTFHADVEPILQDHCLPCHREGQIGPFELRTYEDAAGWSGMIREVVKTGRMPPWHANPRYGVFSNDRSLTESERDTLIRWVEAGAPRGDPERSPPPPEFHGEWQIGEPDAVFEMPRSFRVPAEGVIDYQYFAVDTGFEEDRWVRAMEVLPGARDVVHHILVFCIDPEHPRKWRRQTRGGVKGYFAAMVPGERPAAYPEGTGKRIPAGARLLFQVHYTATGRERLDRSKLGLIFAEGPVSRAVRTSSVAEVDLHIPANTAGHEVRAYETFGEDALLLSFLPHMHYRGSAFRYVAHYPARAELSRPPWKGASFSMETLRRLRWDGASSTLTWRGELDEESLEELLEVYEDTKDREALRALAGRARSEVLLDVPAYDFGWQNTYRLAEPARLPAGTLLEGIARFDNSPSNPWLTRDMWSRPVRWGDQSWDEMMIGYFDWVSAASDPEEPAGGS